MNWNDWNTWMLFLSLYRFHTAVCSLYILLHIQQREKKNPSQLVVTTNKNAILRFLSIFCNSRSACRIPSHKWRHQIFLCCNLDLQKDESAHNRCSQRCHRHCNLLHIWSCNWWWCDMNIDNLEHSRNMHSHDRESRQGRWSCLRQPEKLSSYWTFSWRHVNEFLILTQYILDSWNGPQ